MKLLFIENRYQTVFWEEIGRRLQHAGCEIHWIVQNHSFCPGLGTQHIIPYPHGKSVRDCGSERKDLLEISKSDRNINYFGGDSRHYLYYDEAISRILQSVQPKYVFGESTQFHELITIARCRDLGIKYLQPASTRYPAGRFAFYEFDTLNPFGGSGEWLSDATASELVDVIARRAVVPDYMQKRPAPRIRNLLRKIEDRLRIAAAHFGGERFATPNPMRKWKLEKELGERLKEWESLAKTRQIDASCFKILFPLQMQPEANLDVWGRPHRCQAKIVRELLALTDSGTQVIVKMNPKPKYEMDRDLLAAAAESPRCVPLPLEVSMGDVFSSVDLIVTVTGTVAIEATLAGKPVVTLADVPWNRTAGCVRLQSLGGIGTTINQVRSGTFPHTSGEDARRFMKWTVATSYPGITTAPFSNPLSATQENLARVAEAFAHVVSLSIPRTFVATGSEEIKLRTAPSSRL